MWLPPHPPPPTHFFFCSSLMKSPPHVSEALCKCHLSATYFRRKSFGSPNTNSVFGSLWNDVSLFSLNHTEVISTDFSSSSDSNWSRSLFNYLADQGSVLFSRSFSLLVCWLHLLVVKRTATSLSISWAQSLCSIYNLKPLKITFFIGQDFKTVPICLFKVYWISFSAFVQSFKQRYSLVC